MSTNLPDSTPAEDTVFDVDGACKFLRICRETFYGEIRAGRLKTFRIKSRRLIRLSSLMAYIEDREREAATAA